MHRERKEGRKDSFITWAGLTFIATHATLCPPMLLEGVEGLGGVLLEVPVEAERHAARDARVVDEAAVVLAHRRVAERDAVRFR